MQLQSKNLNKVRAFTLCYLEILLQGVFRIWFCIPALGLAGKYLCSGRFDSIGNQLTVDSYTVSTPTYSHQASAFTSQLSPSIRCSHRRHHTRTSNLNMMFDQLASAISNVTKNMGPKKR